MTLMGAINYLDAVKPNTYGQVEKIKWLSFLDERVKSEIIDTHEGLDFNFFGYDDGTALTTELLIPAPYDEVYIFYLESKIDYHNGEIGKYNNSIAMFNNAYQAYQRHYNRTHMPRGGKFVFSPAPTFEIEISTGVAAVTVKED